jgi:hypothetical protein
MKLFNRKSQLQRLRETVNDSLDAASGIASGLPGRVGSGKALNAAMPKGKALKAGLIAGGLVGLTVGSAGISSLRRRKEGGRDDS